MAAGPKAARKARLLSASVVNVFFGLLLSGRDEA